MKKILLLCCLLFGFTSLALAQEKRVALVIGNDSYQGVTKLEKAANDARAVGDALRKAGFEVLSYTNLDRRAMNQAIGRFTDKVAGGGVGVFFFAGHGVQAGGSNFLLPIDIHVKDEQDLLDEAIDMQRLLERLTAAKAKLSLLVIDACRDNPFKKTHGRSIGATRGLAVPQAPSGTMVVYSAGIGQQALDKLSDNDNNPNGLFTREFLPAITTPGLRIDEAVKRVRSTVISKAKSVGHEQNPAIYDQTDGDFYFLAARETPPAPVAAPVSAGTPAAGATTRVIQVVDPVAVEISFWDSIKDSQDPSDYQEYLKQYPEGRFAGLAQNRLKKLKAATAGTTAAPTTAAGRPATSVPVTKAAPPVPTPATATTDTGNTSPNWLSKLKEATLGGQTPSTATSRQVDAYDDDGQPLKGPKEQCADRPNLISQSLCESRECRKPHNANEPYCDRYRQQGVIGN